MKLFWTENARQDLQAIRRYIAADNPTAAKRWVDRLRERARNALHAPHSGRKVPEFSRDDIRELIEGNYRIVYQVFQDHLVVLTVFEGHRLFPEEKVDDSAFQQFGGHRDSGAEIHPGGKTGIPGTG